MRYVRSMREHRGRMSAIARSCPACGNDLPAGARFCASCGARSGPLDAPVTYAIAERRIFGVIPGASALAAVQRTAGRWWAVLRSRIRLALAVVDSRVNAGIARLNLRRELRAIERERARALQALGDAVYREDSDEGGRVRRLLAELDKRTEAANMQLEQIDRYERERIAGARMESGPTNVLEPEPPPSAPEPPLIPEPEPVPHEPPGPVIVPEPEPVPHEPTGPVIVPEPEPPAPRG
jgi:hypothetical protein